MRNKTLIEPSGFNQYNAMTSADVIHAELERGSPNRNSHGRHGSNFRRYDCGIGHCQWDNQLSYWRLGYHLHQRANGPR